MRARALSVALAGALGTLLVLALSIAGTFDRAELRSIDVRFDVRGSEPADGIAIVGIDENTFDDLQTTWPFPRRLHGQMIDLLRDAGARQIVYDIQFTEPSQRPRDDQALFAAVDRADGIVLATGESDARGRTRVLGGDANLRRIGAVAAAANLPPDPGGVVRRYEQVVGALPSIAVTAADQIGEPAPRFGSGGDALIDFRGPPGTIATYSFSDVLSGQVDAERLRGQIVIVGATAPVLQDLHPTSASGRQMAGPEIQANAILTALDGNPLRSLPPWVSLIALIATGISATLCVMALGPVRGAAAATALGLLYAMAAQLAFAAGLVLPLAAPVIALGASAGLAVLAATAVEVTLRRQTSWRNSELELAVRDRTQRLEAMQAEIVDRLARAAEMRDDDTGQHVDRMSNLCELVALELGQTPDDAALLRKAAALHDIGKIGLPDSILRKPGRLTADEIYEMRLHTTQGASLLTGSDSPIVRLAETIALTHHERWNGEGYPAGLKGEAIPLAGRIAAVCDVFDALVNERPYKHAWTVAEACAEIRAQRGLQFDSAIADALLTVVDRHSNEPPWVADVADVAEEQPTPAVAAGMAAVARAAAVTGAIETGSPAGRSAG